MSCWFNNNIWCIEIKYGIDEEEAQEWFNNNIWCIEIDIQFKYAEDEGSLITTYDVLKYRKSIRSWSCSTV